MAKGPAGEEELAIHFPLGGLSLQYGYGRQPNIPMGGGVYGRTTPVAKNVRVFDPRTDRARGGQRAGTIKYIAGQINGSTAGQCLASVTQMEGTVPGSGTQIDVFLGFSQPGLLLADGYGQAHGTYNSQAGRQIDAGAKWTFTSIYNISALAFVSGGSNPSYTASGIADGTAVTQVLSLVTDSSVSKYVMAVNGVRTTATAQTLPGTNPDIVAKCAVPSGSYHVVTALQSTGVLMACGIATDGTVAWSATSVAATSEAIQNDYFPYGIWSCVSGTYLLTLCPQNTGLVRCLVADGTSGSVITTKTAINAMAGGDYTITSSSTCEQAVAATSAGVAAVVLHGTETVDTVLTKASAIAFITASTGSSAFSALTGLATEPEIPDQPNRKMLTKVATDGTNFYVAMMPAAYYGANTYAVVVKKVNGTTGAVLWTAELSTYNPVTMVYVSGLNVLEVYGSNFSVAINGTTGAISGAGVLGESSNGFPALCDAGSLTPGAESIETGSAAGPRDILIGIAGGTIKVAYGGSWRSVTSGTTAMSATAPQIRWASQNGYIYFVDGVVYKRYNPRDNTMATWTAAHGTLPTDALGNTPRLICLWNGRIVLSGLPRDDRNWFMSAQDDAEDFEYGTTNMAATDAVAGNNGPLGKVGDTVTALIPFTNDILVFGGDHSIYALRGDPLFGGKLDLVTDMIGMPFGVPWCKGPDGTLYFFSTPSGIYRLGRDGMPVPIGGNIQPLLRDLDLLGSSILMAWDDAAQGLHVFVTPLVQAAATHFFWESRANAWTTTVLPNVQNPLCCHTYEDPSRPGQSLLIGGGDGYVRTFSPVAGSDDGEAIESEVWLGPIHEMMLSKLQGNLGEGSGAVNWAVHEGRTAEEALSTTAYRNGVWTSGRNLQNSIRVAAHSLYVKLTAANYWSMESVTGRMMPLSKFRRGSR